MIKVTLPDDKCKSCQFYEPTDIFDLCQNAASQYRDNMGKDQFHTISHMRSSHCSDARLRIVARAA